MSTYGYASILELDGRMLSRLFDAAAFEPARAASATGPAAELVTVPIGDARLDVLLGTAEVVFPVTPSARIGLRIPLARVAYEPADPAAAITIVSAPLAVEIEGIELRYEPGTLVVDGTRIGAADVHFAYLAFGTWIRATDAELAAQLRSTLPDLDEAAIAMELARGRTGVAALARGATDQRRLPIDASPLGGTQIDVVAFADPERAGTLQLRVHDGTPGDRSAGGPSLRAERQHFAFVMSPSQLRRRIEASIESLFPSRRETFDVEVPPGTNSVAVHGPGTATPTPFEVRVFSPASDSTRLRVAAGVLERRTRGKVHNWTRGTEHAFEVEAEGALELSIEASPADRVGITLERRGLAGGQFTYGRPSYVLDEKEGIELHAGLDVYLTDAPLAADVTMRVALEPDRARQLAVQTRLDGLVLGGPTVHAAYFFGALFSSLSIVGWSLVKALVADPMAAGKVAPVLRVIGDAFQLSAPSGIALFLEELSLTRDGLRVGGPGDAGPLAGSGRAVTNGESVMMATGGRPVFLGVEGDDPRLARPSVPTATLETSAVAARSLWALGPDEIAAVSVPAALVDVAVPAGHSALLLADGDARVKVLLERDIPGLDTRVSWVAYAERAVPHVRLVDEIERSVTSASRRGVLHVTEYRYEGRVRLERVRVFLTEGTRARGRERWRWNGIDLDDAAPLAFPWGTVALDGPSRALLVRVEPGVPDTPLVHVIEVQVEDVLGTQASARATVATPTHVLGAERIAIQPDALRDPRGPWIDPIDRTGRVRVREIEPLRTAIVDGVLRAVDRLR